jgi:hypothetical protein
VLYYYLPLGEAENGLRVLLAGRRRPLEPETGYTGGGKGIWEKGPYPNRGDTVFIC